MSIQREYHVENAKNRAHPTVPFPKSSKMYFDKDNANNANSMITPIEEGREGQREGGWGGGRRRRKKEDLR